MVRKERFDASMPHDGRFRMLIDAVTDYAIYMLDTEGIVSSWNSGARRLKGYEESEILGEHFSRFYTEADREAGLPQRALETPCGKENSRVRDGGAARMVRSSGPWLLSTRYAMRPANWWVTPRSRET